MYHNTNIVNTELNLTVTTDFNVLQLQKSTCKVSQSNQLRNDISNHKPYQ